MYERSGVKIVAFDVDHGDLIKPALGYRVEFGGRSVVISGDTRPSTNLVAHAKGADIVIHEVMAASTEVLERSEAGRRIMAHHTSPEDAGRVFSQIGPRPAVYSHVIRNVPVEELLQRTRSTYSGRLELGHDLMTITVEDVPRVEWATAAPTQ